MDTLFIMLLCFFFFTSEPLHDAYAYKKCNADEICQAMRINQAEAACSQDQTFKYICPGIELADHSSRNTNHADDGSCRRHENTRKGGSYAKQLRRQNEYIWNDKRGYAQL